MESTKETTMSSPLEAMRSQEDTCYQCKGYVLRDRIGYSTPPYLGIEELLSNRSFRGTMVDWAYRILDLADCHRETADYSSSYFDRYLQSPPGTKALSDQPTFQLAFVTSLYIAIKMHESASMPPQLFSKLSRGIYTREQIQDMEVVILNAIGWRLNPPTALAFVRQLLTLVSLNDLPTTMRLTVYDLAKVQIELVLSDYRFVSFKKSVLAMTGILNALESLQYSPSFGYKLIQCAGMVNEEKEISQVRTALYQVIAKLPHNIGAGYSSSGNHLSGSFCRDLELMARGRASCNSPRSVVLQAALCGRSTQKDSTST